MFLWSSIRSIDSGKHSSASSLKSGAKFITILPGEQHYGYCTSHEKLYVIHLWASSAIDGQSSRVSFRGLITKTSLSRHSAKVASPTCAFMSWAADEKRSVPRCKPVARLEELLAWRYLSSVNSWSRHGPGGDLCEDSSRRVKIAIVYQSTLTCFVISILTAGQKTSWSTNEKEFWMFSRIEFLE